MCSRWGAEKEEKAAVKYMATDLDFRMKEGVSKLVCSLIAVAIKGCTQKKHVMMT